MKKMNMSVVFTSKMDNKDVSIENLIGFSNKRYYFGYTNTVKTEIKCFPLIYPHPRIIVTTKNEGSRIIDFGNGGGFIVPASTYYNIFSLRTITSRVTNDVGENIQFKFSSVGINSDLYNMDYSDFYTIKFNIMSIKFVSNSITPKVPLDNTLLINKYTNKDMDICSNILTWGTQLPLHTNHSYLRHKIVGITENELNSGIFKNMKYRLNIVNNSGFIDIFVQNKSPSGINNLSGNFSDVGFVDFSDIWISTKLAISTYEVLWSVKTILDSAIELLMVSLIPCAV